MAERTCSVDGCARKHYAKTWCYKHYMRARKHGDPQVTQRIVGDDLARLSAYTDRNGPIPERRPDLGACWLWTGFIDADGYGMVRYRGQSIGAHRMAWQLLVGPIPAGMDLDHLCFVRACTRPDHLEVVTRSENSRRRNAAMKE